VGLSAQRPAMLAAAHVEALGIPMKWGTDSGASGAASRQATLVRAMIAEVPHFSQGFCVW